MVRNTNFLAIAMVLAAIGCGGRPVVGDAATPDGALPEDTATLDDVVEDRAEPSDAADVVAPDVTVETDVTEPSDIPTADAPEDVARDVPDVTDVTSVTDATDVTVATDVPRDGAQNV